MWKRTIFSLHAIYLSFLINFFFYVWYLPFLLFFFLLELFDRQGFDNHAYLFDDISWNREKKLLFSGGSVRKKGVVWLNREDLFQEQAYVWCNVKSRHHVRPCQDLRWFRETRWQFPKQSSVTSLGKRQYHPRPGKEELCLSLGVLPAGNRLAATEDNSRPTWHEQVAV